MVYVDLNPIRAGICRSPALSEYISIRERLIAYQHAQNNKKVTNTTNTTQTTQTTSKDAKPIEQSSLLRFVGTKNQQHNTVAGIEYHQRDYFELVDWTGRQVRKDKPGAIPANILSILERLQVNEKEWVNTVNHYGRHFYRIVGPVDLIRSISNKINRCWFKGLFQCKLLYKEKLTSVV